MTLAPAPVTLDCKATPVLAPESRALVTVGRKAILGAVSVRQVPAERRAIRDIRRVSVAPTGGSGRPAAGEGGVSSVPLELAELVKIATQVAGKFDSRTNERGTPSMPVRPWLTSVEHVV